MAEMYIFCGISDKFGGAMGWKHHKFPIETLKTSDFFAPNLGCLCRKPRYFSSQKSDVFGFRTPFYAEIPGFSPSLPRNPQSPTLVFSLPGSPSPGLRSPSQRPKISNYSDKISSLLFKAINKKNTLPRYTKLARKLYSSYDDVFFF